MTSETVYPGLSGRIAQDIRNGMFCFVERVFQNVRKVCAKQSENVKQAESGCIFQGVETVGLDEYEIVR